MLKNIAIQYLICLGLALLLIPVIDGILFILSDIGWHFLTVIYITIFIFQLVFYYLTTNYTIGWTILSFIVNFIFWTFEQVAIEKTFHDSFIYKGKVGPVVIGGLLWVTNKILIDQLLNFNKSVKRKNSNNSGDYIL